MCYVSYHIVAIVTAMCLTTSLSVSCLNEMGVASGMPYSSVNRYIRSIVGSALFSTAANQNATLPLTLCDKQENHYHYYRDYLAALQAALTEGSFQIHGVLLIVDDVICHRVKEVEACRRVAVG